jgi:hypothetical protein
MLDPFATLEESQLGADVLMDPDAVGDDFHNDDLRLVRCYREADILRESDSDAFVRRLRDERGDPMGAVPADATTGSEAYSPLLAIDLPPGFVTLDAADGKNVVTRVMALELDVPKLDLLAKLGSAVPESASDPDVGRIESLLDQLAGFQHMPGVEALVEERLF